MFDDTFSASSTRTRRGAVPSQVKFWALALLLLTMSFLALGAPAAQAAPKVKTTNIKLISTITSITAKNGGFEAQGTATATIKGVTTTVPFTAPINISLADDQSQAAAAGCPILDLELGPITLNLLGLVVETSPICLTITAYEGGGLLGDLLCAVAELLDGGLSLNAILSGAPLLDPLTGAQLLPGLSPTQLAHLRQGLADLFRSALSQVILDAIQHIDIRHTCAILNLELGPLRLNLLGLVVELDDCAGGPVTVDITAVTGPGNLLGNLLCELLDGGLLGPGLTLGDILDLIVGLLTN
jgi:hypothetical protein